MEANNENHVVSISCKSGKIFSACTIEEADDQDFLTQIGWYAKQGCNIETKKFGEWEFEQCECEHCKILNHNHPMSDEED